MMMTTMRILLVLLLSGWSFTPGLLRQYHYVAEPKTWTEARTFCRVNYSDLATVENHQELNQLVNSIPFSGGNADFWIGLYSNINWKWSDGYSGSGAEYRKWENQTSQQPDFYLTNQYCVNMGDSTGWWDDQCSGQYPFICYNGSEHDRRFVLVNQRMSWSDAQQYCRENHTDLATITSDSENQQVQSLVPSGDYAWTGLFREPHGAWSDGSTSSFRHWSRGSHKVGSMKVVCVISAAVTGGWWWWWRLQVCGKKFPFVCQTVPPAPVKRSVVKLRIKRGDSSVDLNDPTVKDDIRNKLQERLQEAGVEGVSLKWRTQPDGKVFHKEDECSQNKKKTKAELCN